MLIAKSTDFKQVTSGFWGVFWVCLRLVVICESVCVCVCVCAVAVVVYVCESHTSSRLSFLKPNPLC